MQSFLYKKHSSYINKWLVRERYGGLAVSLAKIIYSFAVRMEKNISREIYPITVLAGATAYKSRVVSVKDDSSRRYEQNVHAVLSHSPAKRGISGYRRSLSDSADRAF